LHPCPPYRYCGIPALAEYSGLPLRLLRLRDLAVIHQLRFGRLAGQGHGGGLVHELDVPLTGKMLALSAAEMRALVAAAERHNWSDPEIERLVFHGHAARTRDHRIDLRAIHGWTRLHKHL
jgi:hypothetical protein